MLIRLATIFLSLGSLLSSSVKVVKWRIKDISRMMGDRSTETVEMLQPLFEGISTYPPLDYLCQARNPVTVAWILEQYNKVESDPVAKVKELAFVVSGILKNAHGYRRRLTPDHWQYKITSLCLKEMVKCNINVIEFMDDYTNRFSLFSKESLGLLVMTFPTDWSNLLLKFIESTVRHVENGFDISEHASKVETLFYYTEFNPEHLHEFFQKGLPLDHKSKYLAISNWLTIAIQMNRLDLAYVVYKMGLKIPRNATTDSQLIAYIHPDQIEALADYVATIEVDSVLQVIKSILADDSEQSYLKLLPVDLMVKAMLPILHGMVYADTLGDEIGENDHAEEYDYVEEPDY